MLSSGTRVGFRNALRERQFADGARAKRARKMNDDLTICDGPPSATSMLVARQATAIRQLTEALARANRQRDAALAEASLYRERWASIVELAADLHELTTVPLEAQPDGPCPFEASASEEVAS